MLKFLASLSSCKTILRIAEQRSVRRVKTRKSAGKPNAEWLVRERTVKSNSEKSSGSLNCFSFLTGLGIKANSTKCKSAILICLTAFSSDYPPISDLIHLARCVKFNPQFNPWIVLISLRGTEFNRRINLLRGFGQFNLGLALIGFRTTGASIFYGIHFIIILQDALEILERHAVYVDSGQRDSRALAFRRAACALKSYPKYVINFILILCLTIKTWLLGNNTTSYCLLSWVSNECKELHVWQESSVSLDEILISWEANNLLSLLSVTVFVLMSSHLLESMRGNGKQLVIASLFFAS